MQQVIFDLLKFFGLDVAPTNLSEFIPYFLGGFLSIGIILFVLGMCKYWGGLVNKI